MPTDDELFHLRRVPRTGTAFGSLDAYARARFGRHSVRPPRMKVLTDATTRPNLRPVTDKKSVLVLQWPGNSEEDFNQLLRMEEVLEERLDKRGSIDGHDFGSGEMNIFIETDAPLEVFSSARAILDGDPSWERIRAAFRAADGDDYTILWPDGVSVFRVL